MDCVYLFTTRELQAIANSGPFDSQKDLAEKIGKKQSSVRKLFSIYHANLVMDTKKPSLNTLGRAIFDYIKDRKSIQIFDTSNPTQLLELYVSSEFPELFTEISGRDSLRNLRSLKKKGIVKLEGSRKLENAIRNAIIRREGTFRFLSPKAQEFINDVNNVFNLMSYHSGSSAFFRSFDEEPKLWVAHLPSGDYSTLEKTIRNIGKIRRSIEKAKEPDEIVISDISDIKAAFQARIPHLPLKRLPVTSNFYVEGKDILKESLDKGRNPDVLLLSTEAYFGSELAQSYYPVAIIRENSGQLISREGKVPRTGKKVLVIENPKPSGWMDKQTKMIKYLGLETIKNGEASTYPELGKAIAGQKADIFSVTAPMNFLAEIYGYKTIDFGPETKSLEEILFNDAVFLVNKELALERPEELKTLLTISKGLYSDYNGSVDRPSLKFEHFIGIQESRQLNDYCRNCFDLPNRAFREFVEGRKHTVSVDS